MKIISRILSLILIVSLATSCSDDEDTVVQTTTIVDIASSNNDLTTLVAAVVRADLAGALSQDASYTVFAPTNKAFEDFLATTPYNTINDVPVNDLRNILMYHVLPIEVASTALSDTYVNTLATNGPNSEPLSLQVKVTGGVVFNNVAEPLNTDIDASNGVIHVVDAVMTPADVVGIALANDNFSSLVAALTDSRHTTDFVSLLQGDGPFTVFAPTNQAFQNLLDSNDNWNTLGDIPIATLEAVLSYHVISGNNVQADQLSNGSVDSLGGALTFDLSSGAQIKTSSDQTVTILVGAATNDVQGSNGVVHAIDTVLLP